MKLSTLLATAAIALFTACNSNETTSKETSKTKEANFDVMAESFGDLQILRYQVPGFEKLTAKEILEIIKKADISVDNFAYGDFGAPDDFVGSPE